MTEEEFKYLCLEYSSDLITLHNADGTFVYVSTNCEKITGYQPAELIGKSPYEYFHKDEVESIEKNNHLPLLNGSEGTFAEEFRFKMKTGGYRWFESKGIPLKNNGEVVHLLSISRDISELKAHLDSIHQKEIMLGEAGKMARIGAWELDLKTMTPYWSKVTYDIHEVEYGVMPNIDEAINFYAEESRPLITNAIQNAIENGVPYDLKLKFITAKGRKIWIRTIGKPQISFGKTVKLYGVFQDINKQHEDELQQKALINQLTTQKQQLQEYNQIVSHNLRSPISSLNTLLHFIETTDNEAEKLKILENIKDVTQSLNSLLEELVEAVKVINNTNLVYEDINVPDTLRKIEVMLEGSILETEAEIICNCDEWKEISFPKLYFDSILLNLLSNALKYSSPDRKPKIIITTGFENEKRTLTISDNGLGIDLKRHKDKIFKLHKTFHRQRPGKGLGLFMTRNQIQATGGDIFVESEVDKGTRFKIVFNNYNHLNPEI